jgi:3-deoxy-D-manno-octulosonic-acid transferase
MALQDWAYEGAVHGARWTLHAAARWRGGKLARGEAGWRGAAEVLCAWAQSARDPRRPLVWVQAPSVGEGLMAQAIIAALREQVPEAQLVYTHLSPSAERLAARVGADVHGYLPWDVRGEVGRAVAALRPDVVAFVRSELWPTLAREARARGARLALLNAVLPADSSRLRPWSRWALRPAYRMLDGVGAVTAAHAGRFPLLGVDPGRVRVTGDARFDQVQARVAALDGDRPLLRLLRDRAAYTVLAGSTWPADEARLVPAFAALGRGGRLVVAPHEPGEAHLRGLERRLERAGLAHARLAALESALERAPGADPAAPLPAVVVVDRVGVLAELYAAADAAYVGGGFGSAGLHSVVEPAALGVPVLYGPRHGAAREAAELAEAGGGIGVADAAELEVALRRLRDDHAGRARAGAAAAAYVASQLGGAGANAGLVAELLAGSPRSD